jgi:uncharacterized membrane protein
MADEHVPTEEISPFPAVRTIGAEAPARWLKRGWADPRAAPLASLFYGVVQTLVRDILTSENGLFFLFAYAAAGAGFALLVFATSVVSLPMLLDREKMDTLTAMISSFNAVRLNFWPMVL